MHFRPTISKNTIKTVLYYNVASDREVSVNVVPTTVWKNSMHTYSVQNPSILFTGTVFFWVHARTKYSYHKLRSDGLHIILIAFHTTFETQLLILIHHTCKLDNNDDVYPYSSSFRTIDTNVENTIFIRSTWFIHDLYSIWHIVYTMYTQYLHSGVQYVCNIYTMCTMYRIRSTIFTPYWRNIDTMFIQYWHNTYAKVTTNTIFVLCLFKVFIIIHTKLLRRCLSMSWPQLKKLKFISYHNKPTR